MVGKAPSVRAVYFLVSPQSGVRKQMPECLWLAKTNTTRGQWTKLLHD